MKKPSNTPAIIWILFLSVIASTVAMGTGLGHEVIERNKKGKATHKQIALEGLLDDAFAETRDFRIVLKKDDRPMRWVDASSEDRLRAANLLYHLTQAKKVFIDRFDSQEVRALEQVLIRINITNRWSSLGHFEHDNRDPQYNNAHSIPAGQGFEEVGVKPWNREIWFRPIKEIPIRDILNQMPSDPLDPTIQQAREILYPSQLNSGIQTVLRSVVSPQPLSSALFQSALRQGGTILLAEGSFMLMKQLNRVMLPQTYFLDTAMVPEIIYHEFSHLALSNYLNPTHPRPVVEGMADYFAAVIADSPQLARRIKEYSRGMGKNGAKRKPFKIEYEMSSQATADFVLGMLWGLRTVVGEEMTDKLVWESRKELSTFDSDIRTGLVNAIMNACRTLCENPDRDRLSLLLYFRSLGF